MKVLITGGSGFAGRHTVRVCREHGDDVVAMWRSTRPELDEAEIQWVQGDLLVEEDVDRLISEVRPEGVIHLAAQVGIRPEDDIAALYETNVVATVHLLDALAQHVPNCRTLVVGSAAQYGASVREGQRVAEALPMEPQTHYGQSKAAQERAALLFPEHGRLPVLAARTFNIAGPGKGAFGLIPSVTRQIVEVKQGLRELPIRLGSLKAVRDVTDVRDVAVAYRRLLEQGQVGHTYNVCSGEPRVMRDVVAQVAHLAGVDMGAISEEPERHAVSHDAAWVVGDPTKIERATEWTPEIKLDNTLQDILVDSAERFTSDKND